MKIKNKKSKKKNIKRKKNKFISKKKFKKRNLIIQINGKKRAIINSLRDITENELVDNIKKSKEYEKYFKDKKIVRIIYVKNRLINFILK